LAVWGFLSSSAPELHWKIYDKRQRLYFIAFKVRKPKGMVSMTKKLILALSFLALSNQAFAGSCFLNAASVAGKQFLPIVMDSDITAKVPDAGVGSAAKLSVIASNLLECISIGLNKAQQNHVMGVINGGLLQDAKIVDVTPVSEVIVTFTENNGMVTSARIKSKLNK
jgi:hypothetical protein